jgi:signal transduction histidine kinase
MYNSIRHAYADNIKVNTLERPDSYHIQISDDGKKKVDSIKEGGGLSSLRKAIEERNGELKIIANGRVRILAILKK